MSQKIGKTQIVQMETQIFRCEKHGEYHYDRFDTERLNCADCQQAAKQMEQQDRIARQRENLERKFNASEIPERFLSKKFSNFNLFSQEQRNIFTTAKIYPQQFDQRLKDGGSLVFIGRPGTGKTHLACAVANDLIHQGYTAFYTTALRAIRHVKETYDRSSTKTERQAIEDFKLPNLLIIDEVGLQFGTEAEKIILFEIINQRYENFLPMILISNLTETELNQCVGERIIDRMYEGGAIVAFSWSSYRRKEK